jgi:hypothetical protein
MVLTDKQAREAIKIATEKFADCPQRLAGFRAWVEKNRTVTMVSALSFIQKIRTPSPSDMRIDAGLVSQEQYVEFLHILKDMGLKAYGYRSESNAYASKRAWMKLTPKVLEETQDVYDGHIRIYYEDFKESVAILDCQITSSCVLS